MLSDHSSKIIQGLPVPFRAEGFRNMKNLISMKKQRLESSHPEMSILKIPTNKWSAAVKQNSRVHAALLKNKWHVSDTPDILILTKKDNAGVSLEGYVNNFSTTYQQLSKSIHLKSTFYLMDIQTNVFVTSAKCFYGWTLAWSPELEIGTLPRPLSWDCLIGIRKVLFLTG
jgi:hypothetical protein